MGQVGSEVDEGGQERKLDEERVRRYGWSSIPEAQVEGGRMAEVTWEREFHDGIGGGGGKDGRGRAWPGNRRSATVRSLSSTFLHKVSCAAPLHARETRAASQRNLYGSRVSSVRSKEDERVGAALEDVEEDLGRERVDRGRHEVEKARRGGRAEQVAEGAVADGLAGELDEM